MHTNHLESVYDNNIDIKDLNEKMKGIPKTVWALGFVSMFMDISSEMIHSLLPVFLVSVLHANALSVGLIEGIAEATALLGRSVSGILSDWLGKRKILALAGYGLAALTKPLFAVSPNVGFVFTARFLDRIGKGIRGAPRDAMVADATPVELMGSAYGLRQSMDNIGAFLGPLLAAMLMVLTADNYRLVFWFAVIPGVVSVLILSVFVKETFISKPANSGQSVHYRKILQLGSAYWLVVAFGAVFTLARFSEAFLLLQAENVGVAPSAVPFILLILSAAYAVSAYPVGLLSDRIGRVGLITTGLIMLIMADAFLAAAHTGWQVSIGAALWGLHMGFTQGLLSAMVAETASPELRGTAFGFFSMACGVLMFLGCLLAGLLWDIYGAPATFISGAVFAALSLFGFILLRKYVGIQSR